MLMKTKRRKFTGVMVVCLGTMSTMSVTISKVTPTQPPPHNAHCRSSPSPAAPQLTPPKPAGELAPMTGKES
ncbi:hypothetical protein INR49_015108 [Caranx melampygus]|nr:hypothetical protein INR49_015108 [Caranx melampygus]